MKTRLNDLFDQLEPEKGNELDKKIEIENDKLTEELIEYLYRVDFSNARPRSELDIREYLSDLIPKKYSASQITNFALKLTDEILKKTYLREETGKYINHLIQTSDDKNHLICIDHLKQKFDCLGLGNTKNIKIIGDVSSYLGFYSKSGTISLHGNAGDKVGSCMSGGTIEVSGNADYLLGDNMTGGKIIINGDVNSSPVYYSHKQTEFIPSVGLGMQGGKIVVKGNLSSISNAIYAGDIYHKDKQIVKDGKILDKSYL